MKVYKFGGASVRDAEGVKNIGQIIQQGVDDLLIVVSAMGKTTNKLEVLADAMWRGDNAEAERNRQELMAFHKHIASDLGLETQWLNDWFTGKPSDSAEADEWYDQLVSQGELCSTHIVASYLQSIGLKAVWWDMANLMRTDTTWREAQVKWNETEQNIRIAWQSIEGRKLIVTQGFIGGTDKGRRTTLGREGSDYTAAILGNMLDAESVTIWKDVPGILNADPRLTPDTIKIDELSYNDAVELAYSGAQVIHPKTIRPLANKNIPLYVKSFADSSSAGSVIHPTTHKIDVPVYIWRRHQMLITMRAKDFGFIIEESLTKIFDCINRHRLKVSLIQSSAVTISVCVDATRYVEEAMKELQTDFLVTHNDNLSLLTIRGTTPQILTEAQQGRTVLLTQTTRRTARFVFQDEQR